jgi:hypothetical protein
LTPDAIARRHWSRLLKNCDPLEPPFPFLPYSRPCSHVNGIARWAEIVAPYFPESLIDPFKRVAGIPNSHVPQEANYLHVSEKNFSTLLLYVKPSYRPV